MLFSHARIKFYRCDLDKCQAICQTVSAERGGSGFFAEPRRRGAAVLTLAVLQEVQGHLDEGMEIAEIATRLDLLADTLRKALRAGKPHKPQKKG